MKLFLVEQIVSAEHDSFVFQAVVAAKTSDRAMNLCNKPEYELEAKFVGFASILITEEKIIMEKFY